ncbi:MAG TPA: BrnT family toxin [Candidatus Hydrogenedentes bacterium]|nr:BrnT family toxin [Candidatus Hydrogenedentota bacterium]HNT89802.1 BrnT family toxin [Candidatus Hydrogenedentota bacterium]
MEFEWNEEKAARNEKKHDISFREAATVFCDPLSSTFPDPDHSSGEMRQVTVGASNTGHILVVAHTERGGPIRLISARRATRLERRAYEEKT